MSYLNDGCKHVITVALVDRCQELQRRVAFWEERAATLGGIDESGRPFLASSKARLAEVETAIREIDEHAIPWLHCHPDLVDLFAPKEPAGAAVEAG